MIITENTLTEGLANLKQRKEKFELDHEEYRKQKLVFYKVDLCVRLHEGSVLYVYIDCMMNDLVVIEYFTIPPQTTLQTILKTYLHYE